MKAGDLNAPRFVLDTRTTADLRQTLKEDPQAGLRQAARQFEGLLLQTMLKSMRDATPQDGLLDNDQTRFFTAILDQQLAQNLAAKDALGFAKLIEQQLGRSMTPQDGDALNAVLGQFQQALSEQRAASSAAAFAGGAGRVGGNGGNGAGGGSADGADSGREYVNRVLPYAVEAAKTLGVPPHFLVAHSALESGWGKSEIRRADGAPSYNVFGI